jgi:hypothetical protein
LDETSGRLAVLMSFSETNDRAVAVPSWRASAVHVAPLVIADRIVLATV